MLYIQNFKKIKINYFPRTNKIGGFTQSLKNDILLKHDQRSISFFSAGFTLIETMIYISLFTILVGSGFVIAFQLIESSDNLNTKSVSQSEINFVLSKFNFIFNSVSSVSIPSSLSPNSNNLSLSRYDSSVVDLCLHNKKIKIRVGGGAGACDSNEFLPITTDNVEVNSLTFKYLVGSGGSPYGIKINFDIDGFSVESKKYLRK